LCARAVAMGDNGGKSPRKTKQPKLSAIIEGVLFNKNNNIS